jgi:hypothetical protein
VDSRLHLSKSLQPIFCATYLLPTSFNNVQTQLAPSNLFTNILMPEIVCKLSSSYINAEKQDEANLSTIDIVIDGERIGESAENGQRDVSGSSTVDERASSNDVHSTSNSNNSNNKSSTSESGLNNNSIAQVSHIQLEDHLNEWISLVDKLHSVSQKRNGLHLFVFVHGLAGTLLLNKVATIIVASNRLGANRYSKATQMICEF